MGLLACVTPRDRVVAGPVDVLVDEITVLVPDVVVLDEVPPDDAPYVGVPRAVFEVLSPSTERRDRGFKTRRLLGLGVAEVWLLDPRGPVVQRVTIDGGELAPTDGRLRSRVLPDFTLGPRDLL